MQNAKALITSKTFLVALLQALLGAAVIFQTVYPMWGWLLIVKSILVITIRLVTSQPIGGLVSAN